jgi:PIN domain nuclease of toxin-antitoxin system
MLGLPDFHSRIPKLWPVRQDQPAPHHRGIPHRSLHQSCVSAFDLTAEYVFTADELRFNRDPFDALIVAAARQTELPLITRDVERFESAAARTLW